MKTIIFEVEWPEYECRCEVIVQYIWWSIVAYNRQCGGRTLVQWHGLRFLRNVLNICSRWLKSFARNVMQCCFHLLAVGEYILSSFLSEKTVMQFTCQYLSFTEVDESIFVFCEYFRQPNFSFDLNRSAFSFLELQDAW